MFSIHSQRGTPAFDAARGGCSAMVVALCLAVGGCSGNAGQTSGQVAKAAPYSGPTVDLSNVPAKISDRNFRPITADYFKEIEADGDYGNWKVPPYTAYQQP